MKYAIFGSLASLLTGFLASHAQAAEDIATIFSKDATLRSVCERSDIEGFRYYFFHHAKVRKSFLADNIRVIRPHKRPKKVRRANYQMPAFGEFGGHEIIFSSPEKFEYLKVETLPSSDNGFQIRWVSAEYEFVGAMAKPGRVKRTYGPTGLLTFKRTAQCWELAEDRIDAPAKDGA